MGVTKPSTKFMAAHATNYTPARSVAITRLSFHHIVGDATSAVNHFRSPNIGASAHYVIGSDGAIFQCVKDGDIAWSDGNWSSNTRTISIEHAGGSPGVPYTDSMYAASKSLVAWLIVTYNIGDFKRHRDVSDRPTACPGGLQVEAIIDGARAIIAADAAPAPAPVPAPAPNTIVYTRFAAPRFMMYTKDTNVWGLNATTWANFESVKSVRKGETLEVVGTATHPLGGKYYMSGVWFGDADITTRPVYNIGVNVVDMVAYVATAAPVPVPVPAPVPVPVPPPAPAVPPAPAPVVVVPPVVVVAPVETPTPTSPTVTRGGLAGLLFILLGLLMRIFGGKR